MRLHVLLHEMESGVTIQTGNKNRLKELREKSLARELVAIHSLSTREGKIISAVRLIDDAAAPDMATNRADVVKLKIRPIWCRVFTVCSMKKDALTALVCECEFGKYWIDSEGTRKANLTTGGAGCAPDDVRKSELQLGDFLESDERNGVVASLREFIKKSF